MGSYLAKKPAWPPHLRGGGPGSSGARRYTIVTQRTDNRRGRWRGGLLTAGIWLSLALLFATQNCVTIRSQGQYVSWWTLLYREIPVWVIWGAFAPLIARLVRRYPLGGDDGYSNLLIHIPAGATFSFINIFLVVSVASILREDIGTRPFWETVNATFKNYFAITIAVYAFLLTAYHALDYYRAYRSRELAASQLEASLARARLDVLRMQIHPHFLFNTLHGISGLMAKDVPAARRMIARLSDLLRLSLENDGAQEISLDGELELLDKYVEIQQMRFGDRLRVDIRVEPALRRVRVPRLILQPLVENAIRHGIARHAGMGIVEIEGRSEGESIYIVVRDNGPGLGGAPLREGIGLANTRERLAQLYGTGQSFTIENGADGGAVVTIMLPLRRGEEEDE